MFIEFCMALIVLGLGILIEVIGKRLKEIRDEIAESGFKKIRLRVKDLKVAQKKKRR